MILFNIERKRDRPEFNLFKTAGNNEEIVKFVRYNALSFAKNANQSGSRILPKHKSLTKDLLEQPFSFPENESGVIGG
ncbi:hypothetical protein PSTEL_18070 [Paenibacillus stellifer]|uniref:Uncharacterized protein n=1 Tax=Paenibacillus stellifer TaxID=169760 RepID=A0A089LT60_9BACL|nr:hypothetical protein PSTEL_18070 [Paenibacillus stellifer]